jgi:hypothetical protein
VGYDVIGNHLRIMIFLAIAFGSGLQANGKQNTVRGNTAAHTTTSEDVIEKTQRAQKPHPL